MLVVPWLRIGFADPRIAYFCYQSESAFCLFFGAISVYWYDIGFAYVSCMAGGICIVVNYVVAAAKMIGALSVILYPEGLWA